MKRIRSSNIVLAATFLASSTGVLAAAPAEAVLPPPFEEVSVPTILGGPAVEAEGWKYFYFWKSSISYADAYADFYDCYRFLPVPNAAYGKLAFTPWVNEPHLTPRRDHTEAGKFGLVGDVVGSMVAGPLERRLRQSRMRRCLEPRGYLRFPASKEVWEKILNNYSVESIAVQAKLASSGRPNSEPVKESQ